MLDLNLKVFLLLILSKLELLLIGVDLVKDLLIVTLSLVHFLLNILGHLIKLLLSCLDQLLVMTLLSVQEHFISLLNPLLFALLKIQQVLVPKNKLLFFIIKLHMSLLVLLFDLALQTLLFLTNLVEIVLVGNQLLFKLLVHRFDDNLMILGESLNLDLLELFESENFIVQILDVVLVLFDLVI